MRRDEVIPPYKYHTQLTQRKNVSMNSADNESNSKSAHKGHKDTNPLLRIFLGRGFSYIAYLSHRRYLRQNKRCLYPYLFLTVKSWTRFA